MNQYLTSEQRLVDEQCVMDYEAYRLKKKLEVLSKELNDLRNENNSLNEKLESCTRSLSLVNSEVSGDVSNILLNYFAFEAERTTVTDVLRLFDNICGKRIEILPAAWSSAAEIDQIFKNIPTLIKLLSKLIFRYAPALFNNLSTDGIFSPHEMAEHESENRKNTDSIKKIINVDWNGSELLMDSHLRVRASYDPQDTLRAYFYIDRKTNVVVINYCGKHL